jgi:hypothetical protein
MRMIPKIKHTTREIYFKGDFLETTLFCDGTFVIAYNGVAMVSHNVGRLPHNVAADQVALVRMIDHTAPDGMSCGPIALFCLNDNRVMVYEFWSDPKMCLIAETNGFWKTTSLVVNCSLTHLTPINVNDIIDAEKSSCDVKITISHLLIGNSGDQKIYLL